MVLCVLLKFQWEKRERVIFSDYISVLLVTIFFETENKCSLVRQYYKSNALLLLILLKAYKTAFPSNNTPALQKYISTMESSVDLNSFAPLCVK